jgi:superfamily II DNA or RNA helicase
MGPIVYRNELIDKINDETLAKVEVHICKYDSPSPEIKKNYADLYEKHKIDDDDKYEWDGIDGWEVVRERNLKTDQIETVRRKKIDDGNESTHYVYNIERNKAIAKIAKCKKRVLIIFNRVEHGEELQKLIPGSILIHGDNNQIERYAAEKALKENENTVVLSSRIWQTGKDIPEIENVIHVSGGRSSIMVIQRIGRGTRQSHGTNKEKAVFYDFDDSHLSSIGFNQFDKRLSVYKKAKLPIKIFKIDDLKND